MKNALALLTTLSFLLSPATLVAKEGGLAPKILETEQVPFDHMKGLDESMKQIDEFTKLLDVMIAQIDMKEIEYGLVKLHRGLDAVHAAILEMDTLAALQPESEAAVKIITELRKMQRDIDEEIDVLNERMKQILKKLPTGFEIKTPYLDSYMREKLEKVEETLSK